MKGTTLTKSIPSIPIPVLAGFAVACWAIALLVSLTAAWKQVEFRLLDSMMVASAPNKSTFPITLIGIDEASFAELELQWPGEGPLRAEIFDASGRRLSSLSRRLPEGNYRLSLDPPRGRGLFFVRLTGRAGAQSVNWTGRMAKP